VLCVDGFACSSASDLLEALRGCKDRLDAIAVAPAKIRDSAGSAPQVKSRNLPEAPSSVSLSHFNIRRHVAFSINSK